MPDDVPPVLKIEEPAGIEDVPRAQAVRDFVVAVQDKDLELLRELLTDDVQWDVVGFQKLDGLEQVLGWVNGSRDNVQLRFNSILLDGDQAATEGEVTNIRNISVGFSYFITFTGTDDSAKIKAVRSYLVSQPV